MSASEGISKHQLGTGLVLDLQPVGTEGGEELELALTGAEGGDRRPSQQASKPSSYPAPPFSDGAAGC